jgi:hypothetical protein
MLGLLNTVLSKGNTLLTYVKDGLVMANRFLTPPKLTFPVDASAEFNGTSDYIDVAKLPLTDFANFTMAAWFYTEATTQGTILGFGNSTTDTPISLIETRGGDNVRFSYRDDAGTLSVKDTGVLTKGIWNYVTAVKEGNSFSIYLNGSLSSTSTTSTGAITFDTFTIGVLKRTALANYYNGNLANVAIWNRALSSDEINSVMWKTYEQVSTTESNGLQAWYKLSADEVISGDSTATLTTYANANSLTFEAPACVQTALNGLPDITDARLYSANYDIRVKADGGTVESLSCVETELNAIL